VPRPRRQTEPAASARSASGSASAGAIFGATELGKEGRLYGGDPECELSDPAPPAELDPLMAALEPRLRPLVLPDREGERCCGERRHRGHGGLVDCVLERLAQIVHDLPLSGQSRASRAPVRENEKKTGELR
jgi:hypothetical protein